ncbi:MAG: 3-(methylthio)propionyl-CoA ligase [Rhodospirillales bacterium]|nr:3-(methylthio)propionyl-CoA ligase [Rhodospirillales bacterium]MCW9003115.1 3-(methylthio)propionyl-CoA ligase [Rhodospirillales bacterium]
MLGLMQEKPLLISSLIDYAAKHHGDAEIVSNTVEGGTHRYTYRDADRRARRLGSALLRRGVKLGDRIGTLAWNGYRHLEIYYGVAGVGAIVHTINPRLFPEQIAYIVNHAEDSYLFVDLTFVPLIEGLGDHLAGVKGVVFMCDRAHMPAVTLPAGVELLCYEEFIADGDETYVWPEFDERTACGLCYTSGTTGNPKGALYAHRSTMLHAYAANLPDVFGLSSRDCVLPVVPMFHVNAWGTAYLAPMVGAKLVFPGPHLDGESLQRQMEEEGVTVSAGVPTVWLGLLNYLRSSGKRIDSVKRLVIGGSACPRAMTKAYGDEYGAHVQHAWGMTEMSPLGTYNTPKAGMASDLGEEYYDDQLKQGRLIFGLEMKIQDGDGNELPWDGKAFGDLMVSGHWVCSAYYKGEGADAHVDGWFRTGDVATIDSRGFMQITDRTKDVIKSGGEWISSIDLENIAVGHPGVAEAAVISCAHPKWDERPLLVVVRREGTDVSREELLAYFNGKVAKWWIPDDVQFVEDLPHTATGKILKTKLRERFSDHVLPTAGD